MSLTRLWAFPSIHLTSSIRLRTHHLISSWPQFTALEKSSTGFQLLSTDSARIKPAPNTCLPAWGWGGSPHSSGRGVGQDACLTSTYVQPRSVQAVMLWGVIPNHSSPWALWCCCRLFTRFRQTGYQPLSPMCPYIGFPPSLFLSSWSLSSAFYDHFPNPSTCKPLVSGYIKGNPGWENHCTPTA